MKLRLVLVPLILATTSAFADTAVERADAQSQAASLLRGSHLPALVTVESPARSVALDSVSGNAHETAAALLRGVRFSQAHTSSQAALSLRSEISMDAHTHAATLLSGLRASSDTQLQAERTRSAASTGMQAR